MALPEKAQVTSSVMLVDLNSRTSVSRFEHAFDFQVSNATTLRKNKSGSLHLVVTSFDGHVYIVGTTMKLMGGSANSTVMFQETPCAQRIDVGKCNGFIVL